MPPRTFYCPVGIAFDLPLEWEVSGFQGTEAHFKAPDEMGARREVLSLLLLGAESNTPHAWPWTR